MRRGNTSFVSFLLIIGALAGFISATGTISSASPGPGHPQATLGKVQTLALLPGGENSGARPSMRVISSSDENLQIEFVLPAIQTQAIQIEGQTFHLLEIEGGGFEGTEGAPMLPTFSRLIQIPDRAGVSFEIVSAETIELPGYRPFPMQPGDASGFVINREAYAGSGYTELERARVGDPAVARDLRVVPITFRPVRYDPARETLEIASRVQVNITLAGEDLRNVKQQHHRVIPTSFDRLYRNLVVNYQGPRSGQIVSLGSYVIIYPTSSTVLEKLQPLIEWRTRKGYEVYVASTSETGSSRTAIQSWLRNAYNTWDNPPEYITLIGDTGGSISLPYWTYSGGESDHGYVQLDGTDVLADAHIGRISVDSSSGLELYVTKIVGYESTPYMANTDWYTRACLVGDPSYSGPTTIQIAQWLKRRLLEWGYTEVDTIFSSPWVSQMRTKLNRGDTVFSYRGYWGTSGFDNGDVYSLTNGWKMPFAINLTCDTGSFAYGTALSEAWIRAGSAPSTPTGGIASVGTATLSTHTRYNNCVTYGIWRAPFWEGMFQFGASLTRGKYELYVNYASADMGAVWNFTYWNNLMGDSAGEIWTGVPLSIVVDHPSEIALGANSVTVSVTQSGYPCEGAYVCLWKGDETHSGGYSGPDGTAEIPVNTPTTGEMKVTVTKHDHHPYLSTLDVEQEDLFVGYLSHNIDDDQNGSSSGNGDGQVNPNEAIEIPVQVRNFGTQTAYGVEGILSIDDPYITISDNQESFGNISGGATAWSGDDFDIEIDGGTPNGHIIRLGLDLEAGSDIWRSLIEIPVVAAEFAYDDVTLYDFGSRIDPGESGQISVSIENIGAATASSVVGTLTTESQWVTITDATGTFGTIGVGTTGENTSNRFGLAAAGECFQGHIAPFTLMLQFSSGARDTVHFSVTIGSASSDDPTGPDAYGYYAFDNTDSGYSHAPVYDWIEIDPNHGGSGISVGLSDYGFGQDDSKTFDLPFPFTYYGETFTQVTICSNGWIAMGSTWLVNCRNWNIPAVGAPNYMIAPMWDNFYQSGSDKVYHWNDSANHRYVVQWSRVKNNQGGNRSNFEAILYDPAHHTTETGDGMIVFQYETFSNSDYRQHYSTIGIENADQTDGVMYGYFNQYNTGAATISSGRAIKFVALAEYPRGTLTGTITNETNGDTPLEGATVTVLDTGETMVSGQDGVYGGGVQTGWHTVAASHPSFAPDTTLYVLITEGETTILDFALQDIMPPVFIGTTDYGNTTDTEGPYDIYSTVIEYSDFEELDLLYNVSGAGWVTVPLEDQGDDLYKASIPGQPYTSLVHYYLSGRDVGDNAATDPPNAPEEVYWFWVIPPLMDDDMESGPGNWTHYVVTGGYEDQWHHSDARNHTPGGSWSWKFGDTGGGNYADMTDGALVSEAMDLDGAATLTFWHWMEAEISGSHTGYAYDGGLVEMSIDGGDWTQITPVGSYPYLVREGSGPGPFPAETPIYSSSFDWTEARFEIEEVTGSVRIRFRFGSDGAETREGWCIDDIQIIGEGSNVSGAQEVELLPTRTVLYQNRPNPFGTRGAGTRIRFDLPRPAEVRLQVFDASGRLVQTLVEGGLPAGRHLVSWNGRDGGSRPVGSGVYFYILETGDKNQARRTLVVR